MDFGKGERREDRPRPVLKNKRIFPGECGNKIEKEFKTSKPDYVLADPTTLPSCACWESTTVLAGSPQIPKVVLNPKYAGGEAFNHDLPDIAISPLLTPGTDAKGIAHLPGYDYPVRILALSPVQFTQV